MRLKSLRTALTVAVALRDLDALPRSSLHAAGFVHRGRFAHSKNWESADGTPIQFTGDPLLLDALARAIVVELDGVPLRVLAKPDLLRAKLRAGADAARRKSKRLQDLADAQSLLESDPSLASVLTAEERARLQSLL